MELARSEIQKTNWISTDTGLWDTVFALSHEFGWTAHYIINELPLLWVHRLLEQLHTYFELQKDAAHGKKSIPQSELTPERKEQKDRMLAKAMGLDYDEVTSDKTFG